jgi:hypothetical protein
MHNVARPGRRAGSIDWHRYWQPHAAPNCAPYHGRCAGRRPSDYRVLDLAAGSAPYCRRSRAQYRGARCCMTSALGRCPGGAHNCMRGIGAGIGSGIGRGTRRCSAPRTSGRGCAGRSRYRVRRPGGGRRQNCVRNGMRACASGIVQSTPRGCAPRSHNHPSLGRPWRRPRHAGDRRDANPVCGLIACRARGT